MNNRRILAALTVVFLFTASSSFADEVVFKNGDHLTGKIEKMDGGKMSIKSAVAGSVTVDMKDVSTFASDGPIEVRLSDGSIMHQKIASSDDGQITLAGGDVAAQKIPLSSVKSINPGIGTWTGSITVGGNLARGNTNAEQLNAAAHMVRRGESDRLTFDAGYLWSHQHTPGIRGKHENENDWFVAPKYDYFFTPKFYGYVNARIERDLIADLSLLFTPGVGVGYQWVEKPDFHFNTEAGASWLYRDFRNDGTTDSAALRLAYHVDKKFGECVTVFHNFEYYPGLDSINNYFFDTDAGVRTTLTEKMFAELKADYKYNAIPAPGKEHSDLRLLLGVGWDF